MSERASGSFAYRPALDGLRAIAVAAVIAYHFGYGWARGGFLGVDAFFVLSGYLITTLLLVEFRSAGMIHLRAFLGPAREAIAAGPVPDARGRRTLGGLHLAH